MTVFKVRSKRLLITEIYNVKKVENRQKDTLEKRTLKKEELTGDSCSVVQVFMHCTETTALQSVPVHACMSHCIGMLAPGTQQLTALTSVNKLIAGDWRTTQPIQWNTNCSLQSQQWCCHRCCGRTVLQIYISEKALEFKYHLHLSSGFIITL